MARDEAFIWAENRIRKAKLSSAKDLDLRRLGFKKVPESLGQLAHLESLDLSNNQLTILPESLEKLTRLHSLRISGNKIIKLPESLSNIKKLQLLDTSNNQLITLPDSLGNLKQLQSLYISNNQLETLPKCLGGLTQLLSLDISGNRLAELPSWLGNLTHLMWLNVSNNQLTKLNELPHPMAQLQELDLSNNQLSDLQEYINYFPQLLILNLSNNKLKIMPTFSNDISHLYEFFANNNELDDLPPFLAKLKYLTKLKLDNNPLNPELAIAYNNGLGAVRAYLRAKAEAQTIINEAKLILVGEGEVGKSCLLGALRDDAWEEGRPTTHGIEIKPVSITNSKSKTEITLNGWDFGGQRVYRPTHQLFFSAPAVYLVVWKPREGPQQGFVKEWIKLIKHREPEAKILVVATHGGPQQRQPDIDRQELWDLFGKETVIDFFFVESKPDENGQRKGIDELKNAIARIAASLPEVGRSVPKSFQETWQALHDTGAAYLPLERVLAICQNHKMDDEVARLFVTISHRLGHLIHYEHDPALRDIVILKPNWLATAISFVLDDENTRAAHGLVRFSHLSQLWNDPTRVSDSRYSAELHLIFLRLMERFDLSYRVADPYSKSNSDPLSLIAQLVPDNRPENDLAREWIPSPDTGDLLQVQICRIVDDKGQSATAEGLFYQLIVRLHKYSLGRVNYKDSVHWQRGLVLDDDYNGRALLEHVGNDVRISVRAAYPQGLLTMLTSEVKYLVESFWEGLRCNVMVPCIEPCGKHEPGIGLFEVEKLIDSKRKGRPEFPCPVCNEWQDIDRLLLNAPAAQPDATALIFAEFAEIKTELAKARGQITYLGEKTMGRFDRLDDRTRRTLSRVDKTYNDLLQVFTDEAKEGPRLFSLFPLEGNRFNPKNWIRHQFRLVLWCEHSRLPLPVLNNGDMKKGVYDLELEREWFKKAVPYLKLVTSTLSLVLPVASSTLKVVNDAAFKSLEDQIGLGKDVIDAIAGEGTAINEFMGKVDSANLEHGAATRADGATLRELQSLLLVKDPGFGGLVRVMNKRQEFLWVHPMFEKEY